MMIRVTFYNSSPSRLRTDQHYSLRSFREIIIRALGLVISRVYSKPLKMNRKEEAT
jgi:hypothetical protein